MAGTCRIQFPGQCCASAIYKWQRLSPRTFKFYALAKMLTDCPYGVTTHRRDHLDCSHITVPSGHVVTLPTQKWTAHAGCSTQHRHSITVVARLAHAVVMVMCTRVCRVGQSSRPVKVNGGIAFGSAQRWCRLRSRRQAGASPRDSGAPWCCCGDIWRCRRHGWHGTRARITLVIKVKHYVIHFVRRQTVTGRRACALGRGRATEVRIRMCLWWCWSWRWLVLWLRLPQRHWADVDVEVVAVPLLHDCLLPEQVIQLGVVGVDVDTGRRVRLTTLAAWVHIGMLKLVMLGARQGLRGCCRRRGGGRLSCGRSQWPQGDGLKVARSIHCWAIAGWRWENNLASLRDRYADRSLRLFSGRGRTANGCGHGRRSTRILNALLQSVEEPLGTVALEGVDARACGAAAATLEGEELCIEAVSAQAAQGPADGRPAPLVQHQISGVHLHLARAHLHALLVQVPHLENALPATPVSADAWQGRDAAAHVCWSQLCALQQLQVQAKQSSASRTGTSESAAVARSFPLRWAPRRMSAVVVHEGEDTRRTECSSHNSLSASGPPVKPSPPSRRSGHCGRGGGSNGLCSGGVLLS